MRHLLRRLLHTECASHARSQSGGYPILGGAPPIRAAAGARAVVPPGHLPGRQEGIARRAAASVPANWVVAPIAGLGAHCDGRAVSGVKGKIILAGVDGSGRSADALALAMTLGQALHATPLAAYVHPYGDERNLLATPQHEDAVTELADSIRSYMQELELPADQRAMTLTGDRSPAHGLEQIATRRAARLIVVGSSHRSRVGRVLLGGTVERLLSHARCPVAIAPRGYAERARSLAAVGLGFDGSAESHLALAWTSLLARETDAHVRVIAVRDGAPAARVALADRLPVGSVNAYLFRDLAEQLAKAERELGDEGISVEGALLEGKPVALLEQQAAELDLLVIGSRGYGPARAALLGSVSNALLRRVTAPVLVVPRVAEKRLLPAAA